MGQKRFLIWALGFMCTVNLSIMLQTTAYGLSFSEINKLCPSSGVRPEHEEGCKKVAKLNFVMDRVHGINGLHILVDYYEKGKKDFKKDLKKAAEIEEWLCYNLPEKSDNMSFGAACWHAGRLYIDLVQEQIDIHQNKVDAAAYYETAKKCIRKACDQHNVENACKFFSDNTPSADTVKNQSAVSKEQINRYFTLGYLSVLGVMNSANMDPALTEELNNETALLLNEIVAPPQLRKRVREVESAIKKRDPNGHQLLNNAIRGIAEWGEKQHGEAANKAVYLGFWISTLSFMVLSGQVEQDLLNEIKQYRGWLTEMKRADALQALNSLAAIDIQNINSGDPDSVLSCINKIEQIVESFAVNR